eukprot:TRINITY_DN23318_c0_g1_i7.p1 TRINITY_DN23318_c0_g1~~TRINITY_DN23318_c0_g1_i7.p1  ORF type:complete len:191 (-),score=34.58 TRINITY_DN23318_c0_g1_i7:471-1043(-)
MHFTSLPSILPDDSTLSPNVPFVQPQSLSSLCSWWESTHAKDGPLPQICHEYTSPDKLLTGYVAPPMQYNFARVASGMFLESSKQSLARDIIPVEHVAHGAARSIGLIGISLGVLFIIFIIAFISCIKRRKTVQTFVQDDHRSAQVIFRLDEMSQRRKEDIPPDYNTVVKMREEDDEDLPSYTQAVEGYI